ncbi:hypothetical protein TRFO_26955 [Tritrichomonas foetus]|uniref:Uncharacterized protein n=1 Tax=Tritrichomonas foetus TaxID=1144522 RepID=A0A1J4K6H8_9EUKA|nr:hypothetical protein TRFO_26955 [Tritrichomonas foetus]|eukprot:OHT05324.1 hypothetical protein TRFO_26955 [Tritrichomonas foetus]
MQGGIPPNGHPGMQNGMPPNAGHPGMQNGIPQGMPQGMHQGMQVPVNQPGMPQATMNRPLNQGMNQGMSQGMPPNAGQNLPPGFTNPNQFDEVFASASNFLNKLYETPTCIPDKVISNIAAQAGLNTTDPKLIRLIGFAAQHFMITTAVECLKVASSDDLQLEDVKKVLAKKRINIDRPEYIVSPAESEPQISDDNQSFDMFDDSQTLNLWM